MYEFELLKASGASTNYPVIVRLSNSGGGEIFRTRPDQPCGPSSLLYNGYWVSFPKGKAA